MNIYIGPVVLKRPSRMDVIRGDEWQRKDGGADGLHEQ